MVSVWTETAVKLNKRIRAQEEEGTMLLAWIKAGSCSKNVYVNVVSYVSAALQMTGASWQHVCVCVCVETMLG